MIARWLAIITVLILLLVLAYTADPLAPTQTAHDSEPVAIFISRPVAMFPNGYFRVRFRLEPHADNRLLRLGYIGPENHLSDEVLHGAAAPITRWREFKDLPPGEYEAVAELIRVINGNTVRHTARVNFRVIGLF